MKSTKTKTNSKTTKVAEKEKPKRERKTSNNEHLPGIEEVRAKERSFIISAWNGENLELRMATLTYS